jgi:hypothetical protein
MAELKTRPTKASVAKFIGDVADPQMRADCKRVAAMMEKATGAKAEMWGSGIIGFGRWYFRGKKDAAEWPRLGFSPRKGNLTLYVLNGFKGQDALLAKMGSPACGVSCVYVKRLDDLHLPTLARVMAESLKKLKQMEQGSSWPGSSQKPARRSPRRRSASGKR